MEERIIILLSDRRDKMLLIINESNKIKTWEQCSQRPDGEGIIYALGENEKAIKLHDVEDAELIAKIKSAYEYEILFDADDNFLDINVTKTHEQRKAELEPIQAKEIRTKEILAELATLDVEIPRVVEDIIQQGEYNIHESKEKIIERKQELRLELSLLEGGE
jgi:tRNA G10  N-methylase Trm11